MWTQAKVLLSVCKYSYILDMIIKIFSFINYEEKFIVLSVNLSYILHLLHNYYGENSVLSFMMPFLPLLLSNCSGILIVNTTL